ncbi:hypothetical protein CROQUDRAFT_706081 [Cronartium quercuum f. sp. fusiforme G11]|uniref:Uncharacterized protein n=1 Tax=Cronartium quercuum f. sp. fusiforme G11 TaxID=708437 RepID=A0A9P6NW10_9BASI|nr:hypothetical protein CROQUDRAFT_706081 [Cronartium quercuum f. sp. fusiforme G11]
MTLSKSPEAAKCYREWNTFLKQTISKQKKKKRNHWRTFLAKTQGNLTFKAFAYTQSQASGAIASLLSQ